MNEMTQKSVIETKVEGLKLRWRGKVRDVYDMGETLLIVATDRISAFDVVLPTPIPDKGKLLTQISAWWFRALDKVVPNHLISTDVKDFPIEARRRSAKELEGRSMLVKSAKRVDIECVVRGYIAGSGWKEYQKTGELWGRKLPKGLQEAERLPQPIFTPTTKAETGHDEPMTPEQVEQAVGAELAKELEKKSLALFEAASKQVAKCGLLLADTKFEFGHHDGKLILIDEALTPDSSRYWDGATYKPGKTPDNFDKQFVRDYLESLKWDKRPPAPTLPAEVVRKTAERYAEVLKRLQS
jgi:phosphoribosylaminoimidazole-succinocarboxamide synthase